MIIYQPSYECRVSIHFRPGRANQTRFAFSGLSLAWLTMATSSRLSCCYLSSELLLLWMLVSAIVSSLEHRLSPTYSSLIKHLWKEQKIETETSWTKTIISKLIQSKVNIFVVYAEFRFSKHVFPFRLKIEFMFHFPRLIN